MAISKEERLERYRKKLQDMKDGKDGEKNYEKLEYFKCQPGLNTIRIIPPFGDRMDFWAEVYKTWQAGPSFRGPIIRPQNGEEDPVGEEIERLKAKLPCAASEARLEALKASKSNECFIIDRNNVEKGIQGFHLNWTLMNEVLALFADSDYGDITDPDTGHDLKITYTPGERKSGGGWSKKPQYQVTPRPHPSPLDFPEATACDLFDKYGVGEPTEPAFARAVLAGTEKAFIEARKAEREAGGALQGAPVPAPIKNPPPPPSTPAPEGSMNEAVQKQLDELRAQKASPPPPAPKAPETPKTPDELLNADYWIVENNESVQKPGFEIQNLVNAGDSDFSCMKDGDDEWSSPDKLGFIPVQKSQVGQDLSEALK